MTHLVRLRPVTEDDLTAIERMSLSEEDIGSFNWSGWQDPSPLRKRWQDNRMLSDSGGMLSVVTGGDEFAGFVSWRKVLTGVDGYCWELGISLLPAARGRGHGTKAQRLLVRYLFDHTQVNRIQALTEVENAAERRSLDKAGFTQEGVLRGTAFRHGRWHDEVMYSVIRSDVDKLTSAG